uniref:Uncharacterized protein n=1 Tax=Panagrolaimus sp. PS1159 TaxID=55785 RepID=A0AC35GYW5_9BILA
MILSSNVEELDLLKVTVRYSDGNIVPLEKIVGIFPNLTGFLYNCTSNVSFKTVKELLKIPHFTKIQIFYLWDIPDTFDIETFYTYMKENEQTKFNLFFCDAISEVYKIRLEEIIDEIIAAKDRNRKSCFITFPGLDREKERRM